MLLDSMGNVMSIALLSCFRDGGVDMVNILYLFGIELNYAFCELCGRREIIVLLKV